MTAPMILPCPHCKKRFKLSPERLPERATKLKCPACRGIFVVDPSPLRRVAPPVPEPLAPARSDDGLPGTAPTPAAVEDEAPGERPPRRNNRAAALWLLFPASGILLALIGILAPGVWKTPAPSVHPTTVAESTTEEAREATAQLRRAEEEASPPDGSDPYRFMWPFSQSGKQKRCAHLKQHEEEWQRKKAGDPDAFYAPWIAYLSLEFSSTPACDLDGVFRAATEEIGKGNLCGRGYAFLAAYYSYKRVADRSRSFLEEALQLSPEDPWVRLTEGLVYQRDLRDRERAARTLSDLLRKKSGFALAQYHLAKIYLEDEEYGKAKDLFLRLEKAFPEQRGFMQIRQSLAGIEQVPYYSGERAQGLLKVSRALSDLMDYPLAGRLCRKVLEDLHDTLPKEAKTSAFYHLGRISEITGDKETAFSCYQKALRIDPFYQDARERIGSILRGDARTS